MPLMDRIHTVDFLNLPFEEQHQLVSRLHIERADAIVEARTKAKGTTKSAAKNKAAKKTKSATDKDVAKLAKILKELPEEKREAFKELYGL